MISRVLVVCLANNNIAFISPSFPSKFVNLSIPPHISEERPIFLMDTSNLNLILCLTLM